LKKELKPVYDRLDTSGAISKRRLFTDDAVSIFQQDGARAHTSAVSRAWLTSNIPNYIENWPPNSPDLSPIENLWSILSNDVYKDPEPKTVDQLKHRLRNAWNSISVETLDNLVKSLPRRMKAVVANKGCSTIAY
jgi:transposase